MKIFHGTTEIAGQMGVLSSALKRKGHCSVGYNTFHSYLGYTDHLINTDEQGLKEYYQDILDTYDVFHFHYGTTLSPDFSDLPEIQKRKKRMIMHHWGNDVRFHDQARLHNPYVYTGDSPPNEEIRAKLEQLSTYIKEAIVQDYEVYDYVKDYYEKVHVVPIAIEISAFQPSYPSIQKERPLILHAPTNPDFKGTDYIEEVIKRLKDSYDFDYRRIEKMKHEEVIKLYEEADIIIDQVRCGSYGMLSVESMALGKPVLTYIRPDLVSTFPPELPIINTNPDQIEEHTKRLLENPQLRRDLGIKGRRYVETYHTNDVVAEQLLKIYQGMKG